MCVTRAKVFGLNAARVLTLENPKNRELETRIGARILSNRNPVA